MPRKERLQQRDEDAASRFQVSIKEPLVTHEVSLVRVREWLGRSSSNPADVVRRQRLQELLEDSLPKAI
jgi:hypothetical protein